MSLALLRTRFDRPNVLWGLAVWALLVVLYFYFFALRAHVTLDIQVADDMVTDFKIYWAENNRGFSEANSNRVRISKDSERYTMLMGNLGSITRLRIDPLEEIGELRIDAIYIEQPGFKEIYLWHPNHWQQMEIVQQLDPFEFERRHLKLKSTGTDSQLVLNVSPQRTGTTFFRHIVIVFILGGVGFLITALVSREGKYDFGNAVPVLIFTILILCTVMAAVSNFNVHPDEKAHYKAVEYYSSHILPPDIEGPEAADSFSDFGYSRLSSYEAFYPLAGYFSWILKPISISPLLAARVFNLLLLGLLIVIAIQQPAFRVFTIPLMITPQAWYLFSYVNSDAMALVLVLLASYQIAEKDSSFNRYIQNHSIPTLSVQTLCLGILFGLLLVLKPNNLFFLLFVLLYLIWRIYYADLSDPTTALRRIGLILLIACIIPFARYGLDVLANGPNPGEKHQAMIDRHAEYLYRPSTDMEDKHINLYMKDRGITLDHMLHYRQWPQLLFASSFGSYGYLQYQPSNTLYNLFKYLGIIALVVIAGSILLRAPRKLHTLLLIVLACSLLLILASMWRSWTVIFQPQGRYLTPILAMAGVLLYHARPWLSTRWLNPLLIAMFTLSLYSYVFIGINQVAKTSYKTERPIYQTFQTDTENQSQ